jgi:hypothetical protein
LISKIHFHASFHLKINLCMKTHLPINKFLFLKIY